jgi:hypothetical protein
MPFFRVVPGFLAVVVLVAVVAVVSVVACLDVQLIFVASHFFYYQLVGLTRAHM